MKPRSSFGFVLILVGLVVAGAVGFASQRRQTMALHVELESARIEKEEWQQLRAENQRLRGQQIPASELEALRVDHAALPRLRAELEALNQRQPPTAAP